MKSSALFAVALACLFAGSAVYAQPASAPAGSTGQCKDGSYTSNATKKGACNGHKGVKDWYTATSAKSAKGATSATAGAPAAAAAGATAATPAAATKGSSKTASASTGAVAPGGGPGMVWVNDKSKVYHCQGDKWYGKTKQGEYMSEADAKAKGNHPEKGNACSS